MAMVHPKESRTNEAHIKRNEEALSTCMYKKALMEFMLGSSKVAPIEVDPSNKQKVSKSHVNSTSSKQKRGQKMGVCEL
jgi:hypothetical protein